MIQKIKKLMLVGAVSLGLLVPSVGAPVLGGAIASAALRDNLCNGSGTASGEPTTGCSTGDVTVSGGSIANLANKIVNIFSIVIGAIAILMLLYGGLRYITSGGDSGRVGNAKNTLLYAIIGLVIVALAQIIVNVVLGTANSSTITGS